MTNARTIAICNQKGGVGKTTTAVNLGIGLVRHGKKVLLIDADPQSDLTRCLGINGDEVENSLGKLMYQMTENRKPDVSDSILHHKEGVDFIPSNLDLSSMENQLVNAMSREKVLDNLLKEVKGQYDYILIDCMPSLGMITVNALTAADSVIIPVQAQYLPAKGMTQLLKSISLVQMHTNDKLKIEGIVMTLVDSRTNLARDVIDTIRTNYGAGIRIFNTDIPIAVKTAEASGVGKSIYAYDPGGKTSMAYDNLTKEVILSGERQKDRIQSSKAR